MAETIRLVDYFYLQVPDKPGEGTRILQTLKDAGVNLLAFSGFPEGGGAQLDFVPEDASAFRAAAQRAGWELTGPKQAFLIQGDDRTGVMADLLATLATANINVIASDGVSAGGGRYGVILWVDPRQVEKAAKAFGIA